MSDRLEAFEPEVEVITHNERVVAVLYDGIPLSFSEYDAKTDNLPVYRDMYENGDARDVLAVEVSEDE